MNEFRGKVAVVTGAASGIGRALAMRCSREGMKVVLSDIDEAALVETEAEIRDMGSQALRVVTDVSRAEQVDALAQRTLDTFGAVHLLCNNAGVMGGSAAWETSIKSWQWVLGVNLWGVIHGLRAFVPIMLEQGEGGHIVNTSSVAGLVSYQGDAAYHASKHAVVALTEELYYDLQLHEAKVGVSVLCPGFVRTRIMDSSMNRPAEFADEALDAAMSPQLESALEQARRAIENGLAPESVADSVFQAIQSETFYILTHPEMMPFVKARTDSVVQGRNPLPLAQLTAAKDG